MLYRGIISDFDGTIAATSGGIVSEHVSQSIRNLLKKNAQFCIATGRGYGGRIAEFCTEIGINSPCIVHGGSQIVDPHDGHSLWEQPISTETAEKFIAFTQKNNIPFQIETKVTYFSDNPEITKLIYGDIPIEPLLNYRGSNIFKFLVFARIARYTREQAIEMKKQIEVFAKDLHIALINFHEWYGLDITSLHGTKQAAVVALCELLQSSPQEYIGIGDGGNDYPLLSACGLKIAMGNAAQELKDIADFIAPSVEKDGLATVIKALF